MPLLYVRRYSRKMIQAHPEWLFVFGDNFERSGMGGQAGEARGEPNAVGIATKQSPGMFPANFLNDDSREIWENHSAEAMMRLHRHIQEGKTVIWPYDGIGTGLAELNTRAPKILKALEQFVETLEQDARLNP